LDIALNGEIAVFNGVAGRNGPASRNIRASAEQRRRASGFRCFGRSVFANSGAGSARYLLAMTVPTL